MAKSSYLTGLQFCEKCAIMSLSTLKYIAQIEMAIYYSGIANYEPIDSRVSAFLGS